MDVDHDQKPYSDPQDRGDSDTSEQEKDGDRTLDAESRDSKEYGLPPDRVQGDLRDRVDVHRVPLSNVQAHLDRWADDGSLANTLRESTGHSKDPAHAGQGPRAFTDSDLKQRLPGFDKLERGEKLAVVTAMARLSVGFHDQHGVGKNPESIDHPYRKPGEGPAADGTKDSVAKNSTGSVGVAAHQKSGDAKVGGPKSTAQVPDSLRSNTPDFTDRNYAVIEVEGPPPERETHYVTDSSVPAGPKGLTPRHSEKHLADWMDRVNKGDTKYTPKAVYTEREPCGEGGGHAKCSKVLQDKVFGNTADSKVYYSTTYRTDPEDVAAKKAIDREKAAEKKAFKGKSADDVRAALEARHYKGDVSALSDAEARKELGKRLDSEYKKRKDETTSDKKHAMVAEMDRHMANLDRTWQKMQPSLL